MGSNFTTLPMRPRASALPMRLTAAVSARNRRSNLPRSASSATSAISAKLVPERMAERGRLDCMFFQDSVAIPGSTAVYGGKAFRVKNGRQAHIEPVSAIAALAAITSRIGLVSTCTTSYNEPYNVARRFLTIDHISGGRAGWNLVTSQAEDEAVNFGRDQHFQHRIRHDRAPAFHDVVVGLWDSWEDDAFLRDKKSGVWFDFDKMHILRHKG